MKIVLIKKNYCKERLANSKWSFKDANKSLLVHFNATHFLTNAKMWFIYSIKLVYNFKRKNLLNFLINRFITNKTRLCLPKWVCVCQILVFNVWHLIAILSFRMFCFECIEEGVVRCFKNILIIIDRFLFSLYLSLGYFIPCSKVTIKPLLPPTWIRKCFLQFTLDLARAPTSLNYNFFFVLIYVQDLGESYFPEKWLVLVYTKVVLFITLLEFIDIF